MIYRLTGRIKFKNEGLARAVEAQNQSRVKAGIKIKPGQINEEPSYQLVENGFYLININIEDQKEAERVWDFIMRSITPENIEMLKTDEGYSWLTLHACNNNEDLPCEAPYRTWSSVING